MKNYWFQFSKKSKWGDRISIHSGYTNEWGEALKYFFKLYDVSIKKRPKMYFSDVKITKL